MQNQSIVDELIRIADLELSQSLSLIERMSKEEAAVFIIEVCRATDYHLLNDAFTKKPNAILREQDLNIVLRGWNPILQKLQKQLGKIDGIPLLGSTPETIQAATTELHRAGRSVLLRKTADLIRRKLLKCSKDGDRISVEIDHENQIDLFSDRLAEFSLDELSELYSDVNNLPHDRMGLIDGTELKRRLATMVFPWKTPKGTMVGYHAEPDIDEHYIAAVFDHVSKCRKKCGMHPETRIGGVLVSDISVIILLVMSARLKHTQLVYAGKEKFSEINYWMSLTAWNLKVEIVESLSEYSKIDRFIVSKIIDMLTLRPSSNPDFSSDVDPVIPLFIQISKQYLLEPVSALFMNPFDTFLRIGADDKARQSITSRREQIMIDNINALFQGDRYWRLETPVRLKKHGNTMTDIDAAVLDGTTGELALFQLKWQDFRGATNSQFASRAKNFVDSVSKWAETVSGWLEDFGPGQLRRCLRIPADFATPISRVHLFGIGQSGARFRYLGHSTGNGAVAVTTWPRFVRLRHDLGPADFVVSALHELISNDALTKADPIPMPYELNIRGTTVHFENLWNSFDHDSSDGNPPVSNGAPQ